MRKKSKSTTRENYNWHLGAVYGTLLKRILTDEDIGVPAEVEAIFLSSLSDLRGTKGEEEIECIDDPKRPTLLQIIDGAQIFGLEEALFDYVNSKVKPRSLVQPYGRYPEAVARLFRLDFPIFDKIYRGIRYGDRDYVSSWETLATALSKVFGTEYEPNLLALNNLLPEPKMADGRPRGTKPQIMLEIKYGVLRLNLSPPQAARRCGGSNSTVHERANDFRRKMKLRMYSLVDPVTMRPAP